MKSTLRWYDSLLLLLFFYLLVLQVQAIWPFTIDDMYISLRYAKNWAAGDGLLWNLKAPPVEGYSNFSFVALAALVIVLKGNPIIALKSAGFLGLVMTCFFTYRISRFWFDRRLALVPCIALLLYKGQIIWAISGLETSVYQAFVCATVYCSLRGLGYQHFPAARGKPSVAFFIFAGLFLSLAGLTRPEAPALMLVFLLLMCWDKPQSYRKEYWWGVLSFVLMLVLIFLPYFLWRWHYYGYLFPNSIYCKAFSDHRYVLDLNYLKLIWPFVLFAVFAASKKPDKRHCFLWMPSLVYLILLVDSDPVVAFFNRLFLPAFVLLLPLALQGFIELISSYTHKSTFLIALILLGLFMPSMTLEEYRYFSQNPVRGEQLRKRVVDWLNTHADPDDTVVLGDAGLIPYLSNLNFIDSYCLNNVEMAHYPTAQRYEQFCHKIIQKHPDFIILTSLIEDGRPIYTLGDFCLKKALSNSKKYKMTNNFSLTQSRTVYRYELFTNF